MIDGILAEWFAKQPEEIRAAYGSNGVAYASLETMRASMTYLYEALRAEGVHVFYCRRIINRMLYGSPEPTGIKSLGELVLLGLQDTTVSFTGQLAPEDAHKFIEELGKISAS